MPDHLFYSPQVQLDLDEILDYFVLELGNAEKGREIVGQILAAARKIPGHATRFPLVGPLPLTLDVYRFMQVGSYLIFFRTEGEDVYIDRVLHNRRDIISFLGVADGRGG